MEQPSEIRQRSIKSDDDASSASGTSSSSVFETDLESQEISRPHRHRKRRPADIKARDNVNSLISVLVFVGVSLLFVKYMDERLPTALMIRDDPFNLSSRFIEERARNDLHTLIGVGVRVSGSYETDVLTVRTFLGILNEIRDGCAENQKLTIDEQYPTGEFFMDDDEGHISTYAKISNVIAKLEPVEKSYNPTNTSSAILLNCHFDTKPGSPGATDNMISCVTMLEILRVLSRQRVPLKNEIVFLFNGAEELGLQGAHGFVAGRDEKSDHGHVWAKNLKTFINLEGAGAGGREILFQSGPGNGWTLKAYSSSVPHPYGLVIAEEAFQLGLIPSDTDYRIFRDFSDIPGLDMAFIKNGWVYHTKWDKLTEIPAGSIQHMGENALALVQKFGDMDFTTVKESDGKMIFFDVFGLFMIYYTETVGMIVNCLVALIAIGLVCLEVFVLEPGNLVLTSPKIKFLPNNKPIVEKLIGLIWLPISTLLAWGTGILVAYIVAVLFNWTGYYKPFYTYTSMSFVIFGVPAILAQTIVYAYAHRGSEGRTWLAGKVTIAIVTLAMTFITRVAYVFMIIMLFGFIGRWASRYAIKVSPIPNKAIQRLWIYFILGELVPFTLSCYLTLTLADVFVPILGRSGTETNSNVFFGVIVAAIISILAFNGLVSVFTAYSRPILIVSLCFSVFLINPLLVFGFVGKVPFQEKTPLRLHMVDVDRTWYNRDGIAERNDSGYWFWPVDPNTIDILPIIAETVPELHGAMELEANEESCADIYCAQPFLWPTTDLIKKTPWIRKEQNLPQNVRDSVKMNVTSNVPISDPTGRRISLTFSGPTQLTIVLCPGKNYRLGDWTFGGGYPASIQSNGLRWKGRPTYFIYHGKGYTATDFLVSGDFIGQNPPGEDEPIVDVLYTGSFLYGNNTMGPEYLDLVKRLPSWTNVMGWTTVLKIKPIY